MELTFKPSESTIKPEPIWIDITTVYIRKDISEQTRDIDDGNGGTYKQTFYVYQECALSHDEFNQYSSEMMAKNAIIGANDSGNILSILTGQETMDSYQLATMEAIADLYDAIATLM